MSRYIHCWKSGNMKIWSLDFLFCQDELLRNTHTYTHIYVYKCKHINVNMDECRMEGSSGGLKSVKFWSERGCSGFSLPGLEQLHGWRVQNLFRQQVWPWVLNHSESTDMYLLFICYWIITPLWERKTVTVVVGICFVFYIYLTPCDTNWGN